MPVLPRSLIAGTFALAIALPMTAAADDDAVSGNPDNGQQVYEGTCIYCHGGNGKGEIPGVPDFTKKNGPLSESDADLFDHIANGFESKGSQMAMPARGGNPALTDAEIRDVLAYLRKEFGKD